MWIQNVVLNKPVMAMTMKFNQVLPAKKIQNYDIISLYKEKLA